MLARSSPSHVLAIALLVGASVGSLPSCAPARGVTVVNAGRLDQVRLGFALGLDGSVSPGCTSSKFALRDPIHLSMKVTGAPVGSVISVSVLDTVTRRVAWSEDRPVPPGQSYVTFQISRKLAKGRYRAESTLGGERASPREFVVYVSGRDRPHV